MESASNKSGITLLLLPLPPGRILADESFLQSDALQGSLRMSMEHVTVYPNCVNAPGSPCR